MGVPITLLVVAVLASGGLFAFLAWRDRQALSFASSVVSENSPIAELATRKIVWKVVHIGSWLYHIDRHGARDGLHHQGGL